MGCLNKWIGDGCGCAPPSCLVTICVRGCSQAVPGASVTIKSGGVVVATGTAGGGGCVTLDVGTAGTYQVDVAAAGFGASSASYPLACGGTTTITLTIDPAWTCNCGSSGCAPIPTSLSGSDGLGAYSLTFGTTMGGAGTAWAGCATRTYTGCSMSDPLDTTTISYGATSVLIGFVFNCIGVNQYAVSLFIPVSSPHNLPMRGLTCPASPWNLPANISWVPLLASSCTATNLITCNPLDYSFALPASSSCLSCNPSTGQCVPSIGIPPCNAFSGWGGCQVYGCGGTTFTVTP